MSLKAKIAELERVQKLKEIEKNLLLQKAIISNNPSDILLANSIMEDKYRKDNPFTEKKIKSYLFDPYYVNESLGYKDSPKNASYDILRQMARSPIIKSIITTRVEQVASFSQPQEDANKTGWSIRKKQGVFVKKDEDLTDEERVEIEGVINFLLNAGTSKNKHHGDSFDTFLRKITNDSLSIDQMTFEVVRNNFNKPNEFFATDGATYRLATSYNNERPKPEQVEINGHYPYYVQIYQGIVRSEFYPWELCFGIRNLSTAIKNNGYGISELEDMIQIITWMLNSDTYNGKFFSQGAAPKGLLKISGIQNEDKLDEFRAQWKSQVSGVDNAWKTPVVNADQIDWVDLQMTNADMQFTQWQEYLIKLGCAQFKIDPTEIGFYLSGSNGGAPSIESNSEYKQKYSKDKGLYPLLKFQANKINSSIVAPLTNDKYEFYWTGIEENLEDASLDNDIKKLTNGIISWSEVRAKYNFPNALDKDDFLLSPTWIQYKQMLMGTDPNGQSNQFVDQNENPFMNAGGAQGSNPFMGSDVADAGPKKENPFHQSGEGDGTTDKANPFQKGLNPFMNDLMLFVDKLNHDSK